eukprot:scaffold15011_cov59-Attheya_sp.AAC.4
MSHYEAVLGKMVDDGDVIEDDNLDDVTQDILSSVGSLTAKADDCVETDKGYIFDKGLKHAWDKEIEKVPDSDNKNWLLQQIALDEEKTQMSISCLDLPTKIVDNKECFFEITDLSPDQQPVVRVILSKAKEWIEIN